MKAEICCGEYALPSISTQASPFVPLHDLVGDELLVLLDHRVFEAAADQALDREEGAGRVGDSLTLGGQADKALAVVGEGDDGRGRVRALGVFQNARLAALHDGDARVCGAEVDADHFSHGELPFSLWRTARTLVMASGTAPRPLERAGAAAVPRGVNETWWSRI